MLLKRFDLSVPTLRSKPALMMNENVYSLLPSNTLLQKVGDLVALFDQVYKIMSSYLQKQWHRPSSMKMVIDKISRACYPNALT